MRLSSFTAISISSATRIPQETCWFPQETCLLAKKALVGFRKKLAKALVGFRKKRSYWTKSERRLLARADPARTLSRVLALRALSFRGTLHPPRLPPELFCVCMCAGTRRARRLRAARPDRYELSSACVMYVPFNTH